MALGFAAFFALRPLVERLSFQDLSVFASDVRPAGALVALIAVLVPAPRWSPPCSRCGGWSWSRSGSPAVRRSCADGSPGDSSRSALGALLLGSRAGDLVRNPQDPQEAPIAIGVGLDARRRRCAAAVARRRRRRADGGRRRAAPAGGPAPADGRRDSRAGRGRRLGRRCRRHRPPDGARRGPAPVDLRHGRGHGAGRRPRRHARAGDGSAAEILAALQSTPGVLRPPP